MTNMSNARKTCQICLKDYREETHRAELCSECNDVIDDALSEFEEEEVIDVEA